MSALIKCTTAGSPRRRVREATKMNGFREIKNSMPDTRMRIGAPKGGDWTFHKSEIWVFETA